MINSRPDKTCTDTEKYPAFEFAYYYGPNYGHNIPSGSVYQNGWYLR